MRFMKARCATQGAAVAVALVSGAVPTTAQDDPATPPREITVSLNSIAPVEGGGCRLTFVIRNGLDVAIDKLVFETVLFDGAGQVATLSLFDFGEVPPARPRVRQFDVNALPCDDIGQVLINGADTCDGDGLSPAACLETMRFSSDTGIEATG